MLVPVLRPLSLGEVLDTSFGVYRSLFVPLVSVSVATQAVPLALGVYVEASGGPMVRPGVQLFAVMLSMIFGAVGTAATTFMVAEAYLGGGLTMQQAFHRAVPFLGRLITSSLLIALVTFASVLPVALIAAMVAATSGSMAPLVIAVGVVAALVVALGVFCSLIVTTPALVLEEMKKATSAMGRSLALTRGRRLRIFCALLVVFLLLVVPTIALSGIAAAAGGVAGGAASVLVLVTASILQILVYPFIYVLLTVLYYDLRVRKEGFDLEMLATALQQA